MTTCRGCGALFTEGHDEQHWELLAQIQAERRQWADKESALIEENERLSAYGDALAAQVEALTAHGNALATAASMATGAMEVGSPVTKFCVEAVKRFNAVKASTPQQCLRDVKAESGRAGFIEALKDVCNNYEVWAHKADEYAERVKTGK